MRYISDIILFLASNYVLFPVCNAKNFVAKIEWFTSILQYIMLLIFYVFLCCLIEIKRLHLHAFLIYQRSWHVLEYKYSRLKQNFRFINYTMIAT